MHVLLVLCSGLLFAAMGAIVKEVSTVLPSPVVVFFRNALSLVVFLPWIGWRGIQDLKTNCLHLHLLRSVFGLAAMYCFFYAIAHLHLAEAVLLNYTVPLFIPFIAMLWLGEPITALLKWAVAVGFVGVAFILKPGAGIFNPAAFVGLASGALAAGAHVSIRRLTRTEPVTRIVVYFALMATLVSAVPLLEIEFEMSSKLWLLLFLVGLFASLAQLFLTGGYARVAASRVGPFVYSSIVFASLFDWWFWNQLPDRYTVIGMILVCAGGILAIVKRERDTLVPYDS